MNFDPRSLSKPIRTVLQWQLIATAVLTLLAEFVAGEQGMLSAVMGGAISASAGWISAAVAARSKAQSAGGILVGALQAEGVKIGLMVILLVTVLAVYKDVVVVAFLGTFVATAVIFSMALFVREHNQSRP